MRALTTFLIAVIVCLISGNSYGANASTCRDAARKAEIQYGIPTGLLQAVAIVESGKTINDEYAAWPWTVNIAGKGHYFKSRKQAEKFVKLKKNVRSLDIGCFQINTKWHGSEFKSYNAMFDPQSGAYYAASFLKNLKKEVGSWRLATQYYHSRDAIRGKSYASKVYDTLATIKAPSKPAKPILAATIIPNNPRFGSVNLLFFHPLNPIIDQPTPAPIILEKE